MSAPDPTFRCPRPPDWRVDWDGLVADHPVLPEMKGCPQEPEFHAEGDVWTHVQMVLAEMAAPPAWRELPEPERVELFAAAVLHDVAKPRCTREIDGRIRSPKHAGVGSLLSRRMLWEMGFAFAARERIAALVRFHQKVFHFLDRTDPHRLAAEISRSVRPDRPAILAEADARGRVCADQGRTLDAVRLFAEFCRDEGCLETPRQFASGHTRFTFFRDPTRSPDVEVYDDTVCRVTLMSGLPGSGKDRWIDENTCDLAVVSLDDLREEMGADATGSQGAVVDRAWELARGHLRRREDFVWNATSLSRQLRRQCVDLFAGYRARVRIVYVEAPAHELRERNRRRARPVPWPAIEELMTRRWEVPDLTEAHEVEWAVPDAPG
jgi:predicted kinase